MKGIFTTTAWIAVLFAGLAAGLFFYTEAAQAKAAQAKAAELTMSAQSQPTLTRLTFRTSNPVTLELKREASPRRAVLIFAPKPIDPTRENLELKDRLVQAVDFDDSDGSPKVIVALSEEVGEIRILSADENRVHFVDILRKTELTDTTTPVAGRGTGNVRVIVIDPGHGGIDTGTSTMGAIEKDLTLALARKLRTILQSRFGTTVILTRDSDVALTSEARAAVANNNRADLFISLHMGFSANKSDLGSSVYVIQEKFAASVLPAAEKTQRLFQPWYLGYQKHRDSSVKVATILSEDLSTSMPGWTFPVRTGPAAVLASTIMPAVLIEVGNLNNPTSTMALMDDTFQTRFSFTMASAIERYAAPRQAAQ